MIKAIPRQRDHRQSRLLVLFGVAVLCWVASTAVRYELSAARSGSLYLSVAIAVSAFFGLVSWRLGAATTGAAACGALICFDITVLSGRPDGGSVFRSGLTPLIVLFVLTHAATHFRRNVEFPLGFEEEEKHGRNAAQIIANLGAAAVSSLQYSWIFRGVPHTQITISAFSVLQIPMLSALAEATADTVSSEVGQAAGGTPFLLTNLRRVAPGTDGAVSAAGTLAGIAAAAVLAIVAGPAIGIGAAGMTHVVLAATAGLFFDSLLGATLERRGWIGNDMVNFASTCFSVAIACLLGPGGLRLKI